MQLAGEVQAALRGNDVKGFFATMYGNTPNAWSDALQGPERLRVIVNALTRMRLCTVDGAMEFAYSGAAAGAPAGYMPWFDVPGRATANTTVAFGHWSTLGWLNRPDVLALDTGCVWGGCLSTLRITPLAKGWSSELIQVDCEQAQAPGE